MGSNQFQREYIEYLQERNTELLNKLNYLKENYESKILAKDLNKHYLISALEDMLNICTAIPQEIDFFFEKMSAAMSAFKSILLRKSEMVQLVEKITKVINPTESIGNELISVDSSDLEKEQISEEKVGRKGGTVKVFPMINGHLISTEPRIYLSRVPGVFTPGSVNKNETHQLSPIIEASPDTSLDPSNPNSYVFKEIRIPLEKINLSKMSCNYMSEESPKSRFKGPKTWKKSLSSNKGQSDHQKNSIFIENSENLNKKSSTEEIELSKVPGNNDPLEGPSWLYEDISEANSSSSRFIDYRRRKHRFATVFDKNENCTTYVEETKKSSEEDSNKFYGIQENEDENDLDESRKRVSESSEDFICESFAGECGDNKSPKRKKCGSRGVPSKESKNDITLSKEVKKESPLRRSKNEEMNTSNCSNLSDSSEDGNNENRSRRNLKKSKECLLKQSSSKRPNDSSVEKTPNTSGIIEQGNRLGKSGRNKGKKETPVEDTTENGVIHKVENRASDEESVHKKSKTRSPSVKKKLKSESQSPVVFSPENECRKKRKAAPTFKLVEPNLLRKLRRS